MITNTIDEQQLQAEIDQLKIQFPHTKNLYREVCALLFFRHGITPTANKLYQLVRRGSMSAPSEALNKFWIELREKSRIRIDSPDLPDRLRESAVSFVSEFWRQAQEEAVMGFSIQIAEANNKVNESLHVAEIAKKESADVELELQSAQAQLEISAKNIADLEKRHAIDISTLATQEKTLKSLLNDRDNLSRSLEETQNRFSQDLGKLNDSLERAENQYRSLEKKALLEIDKERQNVIKYEKALVKLRESSRLDQERYQRDIAVLQNIVSDLKEKTGMLNGKISEITVHLKETAAKLKQTDKKLEIANSKIIMQAVRRSKKFK